MLGRIHVVDFNKFLACTLLYRYLHRQILPLRIDESPRHTMSRSKGKARTYEYRMRNGTSGGRVEKPSVMSSEGNMRAGGSHTNSGSNLDGTSISITQAPGIKDVSQVDNITADPRSRKNKFNSDLETAKKDRSTVCEDRVLISWLRGDVLIQAQAAKVSKGCNVKSKQEIAVSNVSYS